MGIVSGECIYAGTAKGRIHYLQSARALEADSDSAGSAEQMRGPMPESPDTEMEKFESARRAVLQLEKEYARKAEQEISGEAAKIFDSHAMMLEDPELIGAVRKQIYSELHSAAFAVRTVCDSWISIFSALPDPYLAERAADMEEIANELLRQLIGGRHIKNSDFTEAYGPGERWIIAAPRIYPGDLIGLSRQEITGMVLGNVGRTSHSAILLREMKIPSLTHVNEISESWDTMQAELSIAEGGEGWILLNEID